MKEFLDDFVERCSGANNQSKHRDNCDENVLEHHEAFSEAGGSFPEDASLN